MKKIIVLFVVFFTAYANSFAYITSQNTCTGPPAGMAACTKNFDCSGGPGAPVQTGGGAVNGYTCNYSNTPPTNSMSICPYINGGGEYQDHSVTGCQVSSAPINSGLIFLIFAGGGLGVFMLKRNKKARLSI